ncbi:Pyridoxamine 5'-phosphate oxidase [Mycobacterium basiliense]|uniref:Pyridoxamine 5'-phosphate oxidase n=1 Tax=Mycobacterium basiliense TaxID=2094119 RepID=A0A3S5CZL9_9MYCO|nr:pyridoxamine 5'-phosphate oxidase family protein [Mycobacterium basiliense]VDM87795.1 Pyridoxamine 5'-phosphate oxidase [Mycobacterium basiliense]
MADEPVTYLSDDQSWDLRSGAALGRLVTSMAGEPEIFPVNYVVQDRTVLFRTAEGTKLFLAATSSPVAFEADDHTSVEGRSVIVKGRAQVLETDAEIQKAERAHLIPWVATLKLHYVRVIPSGTAGRRFRFGPEPDRLDTFA